jgi:hypothetical protein
MDWSKRGVRLFGIDAGGRSGATGRSSWQFWPSENRLGGVAPEPLPVTGRAWLQESAKDARSQILYRYKRGLLLWPLRLGWHPPAVAVTSAAVGGDEEDGGRDGPSSGRGSCSAGVGAGSCCCCFPRRSLLLRAIMVALLAAFAAPPCGGRGGGASGKRAGRGR